MSNFADGKKSETDHWRLFASVMAASLVVHILKDSGIFESWPHFEGNYAVGWKSRYFYQGNSTLKKKSTSKLSSVWLGFAV